MAKRKPSDIAVISADALQVDDYVWINRSWLAVRKVVLRIDHPYQVREIWVEGLKQTLRLPSGWHVEIRTRQKEAA